MEKKEKKKREINIQNIFCFISFIFILVCILWYGGRFIYFYLDNKKTLTKESTTLARIIKTENNDKETFKQINGDYYFYQDATNNYVSYSNLIWRIIKINKDNTITLINDNIISTLAYGDNKDTYEESNLMNWLNTKKTNSNTGKLETILNEKEKYLKKNSTCIDNIDDIKNVTCKKESKNTYLNLLSITDYLYTGGTKSFINNEKNTYLSNKNKDNELWYINEDGKLDTTEGNDILGIKATITLKKDIELKSGTGSKEDPYKFEDTINLIGSYVKLDEDIWRIYEEKDGIIKLVLNDTLKDKEEEFKYKYSNNSYYHNDTIYGSLAYYLNHTYYNSLSYKNLIIENTYINSYYNSDNNYNYQEMSSNTIETKISIPSLDDIILNDTLTNYFTNTGLSDKSSLIYIRKNNGTITSKNVQTENSIVPCISIEKENLKVGNGTIDDPYRTE